MTSATDGLVRRRLASESSNAESDWRQGRISENRGMSGSDFGEEAGPLRAVQGAYLPIFSAESTAGEHKISREKKLAPGSPQHLLEIRSGPVFFIQVLAGEGRNQFSWPAVSRKQYWRPSRRSSLCDKVQPNRPVASLQIGSISLSTHLPQTVWLCLEKNSLLATGK